MYCFRISSRARTLGLALFVRSVAGVSNHVEEHPAQVLRHYTSNSPIVRVQVLLYVQLEVRVRRPSAVISQASVLIDQQSSGRRADWTSLPPLTHHQHVLHDPVCPFAMLPDASKIAYEVF